MTELLFDRKDWVNLCDSIPLSCDEVKKLKGADNLSIAEINDIYLPLSRLIISLAESNIRSQKIPYIVSISGSVAVGKSTTAKVLQTLLSKYHKNKKVEIVTTDGFLYPNAVLIKNGLMEKKGFPQSYDMQSLIKFVSDIKSGVRNLIVPVYSHIIYDIEPDKSKIIDQPDILIIEGLNLLQNKSDDPDQIFISEFIDCSIYLDAVEELLKDWFICRFLKLRQEAFLQPNSYFHSYINIDEQKAIKIADNVWNKINKLNLEENILPTKDLANIILNKKKCHVINQITIRNIKYLV
ncbi:type I pantothenate kinase [Candidatus Pantoea edessiphila]|uniref:Pantothenate kinase n=1 Tax=Candidatus Pantoea edessiphila TaxID=2044610 RepID=A0A2P5SYC1_9GAMM|nr:type I pantothenate kinase [Candidatus Pantoea edessiphila]MBK4775552.1 type I pantothenate kinase [Pantoea sp. Edef]PPI87325.1 type I pantothenate kinase [Candidatus Pantoea edessiphila]